MNTKFSLNLRRACMLALIALSIAFAGNTASAQDQPGQLASTFDRLQLQVGQQQDLVSMGMPAPYRQIAPGRDWAPDAKPFDKAPTGMFCFYVGNAGRDPGRPGIGCVQINEFTADKWNDDNAWKTTEFTMVEFNPPGGRSQIGRPEANSWVKILLTRDGHFAFSSWLQGASLQTEGAENYFSGGAIEASLYGHQNEFGGLCVDKHISTPEGFALSSKGARVNYGSFTGKPSLTFCGACGWKLIASDDRYNHIVVNRLTVIGDELRYEPLLMFQPGTDLNFVFNWFWLKN